MNTFLAAVLVASLAAAAEPNMPGDFLKVESKAWNRWLEQDINTSWHGVPIKDVLTDAFGTADLVVEFEKPLGTPVTFDASKLTRRAALWQLGQKYRFHVRWAQKEEPRTFLGLLETETRKQSIGGIEMTTMTHVKRAGYAQYQEWKRDKRVAHEERIDGVLYFSINQDRDMGFPNGSSAHFTEVDRYKTAAPDGKGRNK